MENTYNFCCICIERAVDYENATDSDDRGLKHSDKLTVCDPNQDWDNPELKICKFCIDKLNLVYEFIDLCRRSEISRREKLWLRGDYNDVKDKKQEDQLFVCDLCRKAFKQKRFLKAHFTKIHVLAGSKRQETAATPVLEEKENKHTPDPNVLLDRIPTTDDIKTETEGADYFSPNETAGFSSDEREEEEEEEEKPKPKPAKVRKKREKKTDSYTCEYCGRQFNRHQHWSAHIRSKHTFEKPYRCQMCEARFTTSHSLLVHKRNHNNEKPYICSTCGKGFVCSGDLFHHNKIHLNKKEYECNACGKRFNTTSILRTHKIVKHTEPHEWKYVCVLCERKFPINSSLTLHMKRHMGVKEESCHICGKRFFNRSEVAKHILSHSNQKNFKCDLCEDKEYKNKEGLNKHLKLIHDLGTWKAPKVEKKFACNYCAKRFLFNNKLQRHLLTHTGEKPFKCDFCEKKFSDPYYRKNHVKREHRERLEEQDEDVKYEDSVRSGRYE